MSSGWSADDDDVRKADGDVRPEQQWRAEAFNLFMTAMLQSVNWLSRVCVSRGGPGGLSGDRLAQLSRGEDLDGGPESEQGGSGPSV